MKNIKLSGNLNQPKYGHLKKLHAALKVGEKALTSGRVTLKNYTKDVDVSDGLDRSQLTNTIRIRNCKKLKGKFMLEIR